MTHLPRHVRDAARSAGLGRLVRTYDPRRQAHVSLLLLGVAGIALGVAGLDYRRTGAQLWGWTSLGLSAAYLLAALWILWRAVLRARVVYLMAGGLVRTHPLEVFGWDELISVTMAGLRKGRRSRTEWRFTLITAGGRETEFGHDLPAAADLGSRVIEQVTRRVLPWYLRAVRAGGAVSFGPFVVDRDGIGKEGDRVPWHAVQEVAIENGVVLVRAAGDRTGGTGLAATVGAVPNAVAFTALCGRILTGDDENPLRSQLR